MARIFQKQGYGFVKAWDQMILILFHFLKNVNLPAIPHADGKVSMKHFIGSINLIRRTTKRNDKNDAGLKVLALSFL